MKSLLTILLAVAFGAVAYGDIQAPPMTDYGPTRKLGRGVSNLLFGFSELPYTVCKVNDRIGNNALGYGVVKGLGRSFFRLGVGWHEIATFPAPCYKGSYRPPYRSDMPWINGGFSEFPPELGWNSSYDYTNNNH